MNNEFDQEQVDKILELGKKAVAERNNNNLSGFEELAETGFNLFPKDFESIQHIEDNDLKTRFWNLGYSYIKMMVRSHFNNQNFEAAKKWLDRYAAFDSVRHLEDEQVWFYYGQYYYETGNFEEAYKYWREVVRGSGKSHNRFFQGENPKYWEFYTTQKKLHDKK
jgi:tetratricopeptide (TPR) repeat protein